MKRSVNGLQVVALGVGLIFLTGCATGVKVGNPYAGVNWNRVEQHKANLHTHTTQSDGKVETAAVIDMYHEQGYTVLALTDHDTKGPEGTTWPWSDFGRDPKQLGMVAVEGNEVSKLHHLNGFFCNYGDADVESEEIAIQEIGKLGGCVMINHPGRYTKRKQGPKKRELAWYIDLLKRYDHILGLEIYNQKDRCPNDRELWDAALVELLPERNVWGFGNDDMHEPQKSFAFSWNVMLLPELTPEQVRDAMENGRFFYAHSPKGKDGPQAPVIDKIVVNKRAGTISIEARNSERIEWVADGEVVHQGGQIDLKTVPEAKYVRAVVYGPDGIRVGTQPFALLR